MRIEDQLVLELCKKSKDPKKIELLSGYENFNADYFLKIIDKHLIAPVAIPELLKYSINHPLKKYLSNKAKKIIIENSLYNRSLKNELSAIIKLLNDHKIDTILMKGLSLDYTGLRTNRDIDILINEHHLLKAIEILKEINYKYVGNIINLRLNSREKKNIKLQFSWNNQYQLRNESAGILLELHTNLFERKRIYSINLDKLLDNIYSFRESKVWDRTLQVYKFSNEYLLIHICMQTAIKRSLSSNNFVLRSLIDIQNIISHKINWDTVIDLAKKFNISSFIYFALTLTKKILNTEIPDNILNELKNNCSDTQLFIEKLHLKCFRSLESGSIFSSNIYKTLIPFIYDAPFLIKIKHLLLIHILFPPKWRMGNIYKINYNNPFIYLTYLINPFRWIYLFLKNRVIIKKHRYQFP